MIVMFDLGILNSCVNLYCCLFVWLAHIMTHIFKIVGGVKLVPKLARATQKFTPYDPKCCDSMNSTISDIYLNIWTTVYTT